MSLDPNKALDRNCYLNTQGFIDIFYLNYCGLMQDSCDKGYLIIKDLNFRPNYDISVDIAISKNVNTLGGIEVKVKTGLEALRND